MSKFMDVIKYTQNIALVINFHHNVANVLHESER